MSHILSGKTLWLAVVVVSLIVAEVITAAMDLLFHGQITYDYLLTAMVVDLCLTPPVVAFGVAMHSRLRELHEHREVERERNRLLRVSAQRLRTLIEVGRDAILVMEADSGIVADCNRQAETLLCQSRTGIIGQELQKIFPPVNGAARNLVRPNSNFVQRLLTEPALTMESSLVRSDGTRVPVEGNSNVFEMDGKRYIHCSLRDITERKLADKRLRLLATAFEHDSSGVFITDAQCHIVEVNSAFTVLTGYTLPEVRQLHPRMLCANDTEENEFDTLWEELTERGYWQGELINRRRDGREYATFITLSAVRDEAGAIINYVGSFVDITERRQAEDRIRHLAHHDPLTNLPNRFYLCSHLERLIAPDGESIDEVAIMFIDLDNFKRINDSLGHRTGDTLLQEVARRLRNSVRPHDVVARLGGDEFVVVVSGPDVSPTVSVAAGRILSNLSLPFVVENYHLHTGASIGVAIYPQDGTDADTLMKNADVAMYSAKARGRNSFQFFTQDLDQIVRERMELENDLRDALAGNAFKLHYQPVYDLNTGELSGFEALLRWHHPTLGEIKPDRLIPVAEESHLIVPLGSWVITEACRQLREWRDGGLDGVRMAVNVSVRQLQDSSFLEVVRAAMQKYAIRGSDIELEITESAIVENLPQIQTVLNTLRDSGLTLAIDDFGTGHSSLARLKQLPIQCLKIDRSFIEDIDGDSDEGHICAAVITLAHSLNLRTVAEGVETAEQREFLKRSNCDNVQGNLFGQPMPPHAISPMGQTSGLGTFPLKPAKSNLA